MKLRNEFETQYDWLFYLQNNLGNNQLEIQSNFEKDGEMLWSKRKNFLELCYEENRQWHIDKATHRSILDIEIVLDLDEPALGFETIKETAQYIHKRLREYPDIRYHTYFTGNKSYHIHIFATLLKLYSKSDEIKKIILKVLGADQLKYGKHMIALEGALHYKSGKPKEEVKDWD